MEARYQRAVADGSPKWTVGAADFHDMWLRGYDELRFHRGKGFTLRERPDGKPGPVRTLATVDTYLKPQVNDGKVIEVESKADGFRMVFRRVWVQTGGDRVLEHEIAKLDTPYVFGVTDCSWLTQMALSAEGIPDIPHNAHAQHLLFGHRNGFIPIRRDQIRPGDLLFHHNDDHVSTYYGHYHGIEAVVDTEPHNTGAPSGWPRGTLGTGVQFRPMVQNYYCSWQWVNGIGRIVELNGNP